MSDVKELDNNKSKNPIDNAFNKVKEAAAKQFNEKVYDKVKSIHAATRVLTTLENDFKDLMKEFEVEKAEYNDLNKLLKDIK